MANDLYFLVFFFELVLFLNFILLTRGLDGEKRQAAMLQQLKSNLPLTAILLTGVLLLSTAADSMNLGSIQNYLETSELSQASLLNDYSAMLGLILIVSGAVFRVGLLPFHFQNRLLLKETTCLQAIMAILLPVAVGLFFLIQVVSQVLVVNLSSVEQLLFFLSLVILVSSAGLLLIEKEWKGILQLIVIQSAGVFLALFSAVCWKWRHESSATESVSIQQSMQSYIPDLCIIWLAIMGFACFLDAVGRRRSALVFPEQLQGFLPDQRLLGITAVVLLALLMGFPGSAVFQMNLQAIRCLFEIHQEALKGTMAIVHAGYLGLGIVLVVSSAMVSFTCARLILQISFAKPLTRYRQKPHRGLVLFCYGCVIGALLFSLRSVVNF
ncbi:proton-conducting transporter transmembrane domain-containing protein [Gimesia maris]|uniref:proton-conducting transporter transmembrane domain-containing protein n=1 Tax=Gimesia maris TaxID=122 RepID=UPI0012B8C862|nr:proton-conducting transporter membrane subunit [Gimesia maris]